MAQYGYGAPPPYDPYGYGAAPAYGGPPPGYGAPPPYGAPAAYGGEEMRTIFITGFPNDVKERELNNLLRFIPGYVASQMNWKNGLAQGFALFDSGAAAAVACGMIAGAQFDEQDVLRCEIARKNMFAKDDPIVPGGVKRARFSGSYGGPPPTGSTYSITTADDPQPIVPVQPQGFAPISNVGDNPPCSTLFVGNLGDTVAESELRGLFGVQPGFKQLKLVRGARATTCFVEFDDVAGAMGVHQNLQGAIIASSDRGGLRIQYSKNPFGKRKDGPM